ncbi:hypothetical protein [Rhodococcus sp. NPDC055024]
MPLTMKYSETYNDALIALAAATHRPANVVNLFGEYAIRVDLEYNRYLLATNTVAGLSDQPDLGDLWLVRFFQSELTDTPDQLLAEASHQWLVDALDTALEQIERAGNKIVADADFGDPARTDAPSHPTEASRLPQSTD